MDSGSLLTDSLPVLKANLIIALKQDNLDKLTRHSDCSEAFFNSLVKLISEQFKETDLNTINPDDYKEKISEFTMEGSNLTEVATCLLKYFQNKIEIKGTTEETQAKVLELSKDLVMESDHTCCEN